MLSPYSATEDVAETIPPTRAVVAAAVVATAAAPMRPTEESPEANLEPNVLPLDSPMPPMAEVISF